MNTKDKQQEWLISHYKNVVIDKDETVFSLKKEIDDLNREIEKLSKALNDKTIENQLTKNAYLQISESKFWKMTLPLQNLLDKCRGNQKEKVDIPEEMLLEKKKLLNKGDSVIIMATLESKYYCELIQSRLNDIGISCSILDEEPEEYEDLLYFVVCSEKWNHLPGKYTAIQLEQIYNSTNLTEKYLNELLNSIAVLDYSTMNIHYFKSKSVYGNKFYYVPFEASDKSISNEYEYDVLGTYYELTPRVESLMNELEDICKTEFIDLTKEDISEYISKAKIVIPMKEYEDSLLDTNTIYQTLSNKASIVIAETCEDVYEQEKLKDYISFVDSEEIIETVKELLKDDQKYIETLKKQNRYFCNEKDAFSYFFYRFLLAYECISFDEFYDLCSDFISFSGNRICLSLPEDVDRRNEFTKDNQYGFEFFSGLRHTRGWTGCGMSYKFIMKKAKEQGLKELIVCEDDVFFPQDFSKRFNSCLDYLHNNDEWDIFQGIMADIGDVTIKSVVEENDQTFVELDHMMSMVFNIYKSDMFDRIIAWDETDDTLKTNTIDRALESKDLRVLTTIPFLVGHKEDLKSTIWGFDNTEYVDWIQRSSEKLRKLVEEK